jgi:ribulose-5-phosphate 4-epimerase/fuculose-1-phosphate aldolase
MILRNHGLLTVGKTVGEAFFWLYTLQKACEIQVLAQAGGGPLRVPDAAVQRLVTEQTREFAGATPGTREWIALRREADRVAPGYAD